MTALEDTTTIDKNFFKILDKCSFQQLDTKYKITDDKDQTVQILIKINDCQIITKIKNKKISGILYLKYNPLGTMDGRTKIKNTLDKMSDIIKKKTKLTSPISHGLSPEHYFKCYLQKTANDKLLKTLKKLFKPLFLNDECKHIRILLDSCTLNVNIKSNTRVNHFNYNIIDFGLVTSYDFSVNYLTEYSLIHFTTGIVEKSRKVKGKIIEI
jgi:hypothetical protein